VQRRRDNHYLDCKLMLHVAALISGVLKTVSVSPTGQNQDAAESPPPDDAQALAGPESALTAGD